MTPGNEMAAPDGKSSATDAPIKALQESANVQAFSTHGEAFCWQWKNSLHRIRDNFDGQNTVASALGVYNSLTEIASDKRSFTFKTTRAFVAMRSGWSIRTVQDRLLELREIGLIEYTTTCPVPNLKGPLKVTVVQPLPDDVQPLPDDVQPFNSRPVAPILRIQSINSKEPSEEAFSTLSKNGTTKPIKRKLTPPQKEWADRLEAALGVEWINDAGKWVPRIKRNLRKCQRVIAELESAIKENRVLTTPAAFVEDYWKRLPS